MPTPLDMIRAAAFALGILLVALVTSCVMAPARADDDDEQPTVGVDGDAKVEVLGGHCYFGHADALVLKITGTGTAAVHWDNAKVCPTDRNTL